MLLSICLLTMLLCSCSYQGSIANTTTSSISASDSTSTQKIITINGKKYTCINEDGTWRCVELEIFAKKLNGIADLNASQQNSNIRPNGPNER